jgi:uncharacterized iron-regulated membrane protein
MKIFFRKLHRWLGLLMALQIAAWMLSGLYFSLFPITEIRGQHLMNAPRNVNRDTLVSAALFSGVFEAVERDRGPGWRLESLSVQERDGEIFWRVGGDGPQGAFVRLVSFNTGELRQPLTADEAVRHARDLLKQEGLDPVAEWMEEEPSNLEFRGRSLPVWRVRFSEPENVHMYLDPWTGDLLAARTTRWRIFDFLWMLHIMDFDTRDDFNTPLLQVAALLGLLVALGGVVLWALTTRLFRRKYRQA